MKETERKEPPWESPSLEWIHRVRQDRQAERRGQPLHPLPHTEAEELAKRFGPKVARPAHTEQ